MKTRTWIIRSLCALVLAVGFALPASAQNFPFPIPGRGSSIGIGDIISIVGGARNSGGYNGNNNRNGGYNGNNRQSQAATIIGLAGALYDISRQGSQSHSGGYFPNPNSGGYYPGGNNGGGYDPEQGYEPGNNGSGPPQGYAFIENAGLPTRLDPRILPLTINGGGGNGDQVVSQAVKAWNNAGIGQVFAMTNGPADLNIDWSGSKVSQGARAETRMIRSAQGVIPTDLSVKTSGRSKDQLTRVLTHELGHVLGLDHSQDSNDVMFASEQNRSTGLTQRDLAMAHWIYSQNQFSPVVGRTDVGGSMPSVASNWASHGVDTGQPVCRMHDH